MPSRVIRGDFNSSGSMARVSRDAELTFVKLILAVDDFGRMDARPHVLKAALFPLRDDVAPADVSAWVAELHSDGCVDLYEVKDRPYLQLTGWEEHRGKGRRGKASKYPSQQGESLPRYSTEDADSSDFRGSPGDPSGGRGSGDGGRGGASAPTAPAGAAPTDRLSDARVETLLAISRAKGLPYTADDVADWYSVKAPEMRARGIKRTSVAAGHWWSRVRPEEVQAAREAAQIRRMEARRANGIREPPPEDALALVDFDIAPQTLGRPPPC